MAGAVIAYRAPRSRIAVAYSTKDRVALTRRTAPPLVGDPRLDVHWFDGSAMGEGSELPAALCLGRPGICAVHYEVTGGPDAAIIHALSTLRPMGYELVILVENDVLVKEGWLEALLGSMDEGRRAGFNVGGASARVLAERVFSFNDTYCLLLNAGAGFLGLTMAGIDAVLANYRTGSGEEILRMFRQATGVDLAVTHVPPAHFEPVQFLNPQAPVSADFMYEPLLYVNGLVVTSPPVTMVENIDPANAHLFTHVEVLTPAHHWPGRRHVFTRGDELRRGGCTDFRFQRSAQSDRSLVAVHNMGVIVNGGGAPVVAEGLWRRRWQQALGPFALWGRGRLRIELYGMPIGLVLHTKTESAEIILSSGGVARHTGAFTAYGLFEMVLEPSVYPGADLLVEVTSGELGFIGLTVAGYGVAHYANRATGIAHLPAYTKGHKE